MARLRKKWSTISSNVASCARIPSLRQGWWWAGCGCLSRWGPCHGQHSTSTECIRRWQRARTAHQCAHGTPRRAESWIPLPLAGAFSPIRTNVITGWHRYVKGSAPSPGPRLEWLRGTVWRPIHGRVPRERPHSQNHGRTCYTSNLCVPRHPDRLDPDQRDHDAYDRS